MQHSPLVPCARPPAAGPPGRGRRSPRGTRRLPVRVALCALLGAAGVGAAGRAQSAAPPPVEPRFREVSAAWGIDFRHHHGASGRRYMVETMSGGVAVFDYDGDGDQDLLFVDGGVLPGYEGEAPRSRLFRNDGGGRFVDVSDRAGIPRGGYGMGVTAGDVDGDGDEDLYLTAFGPNVLLLNDGRGAFSDATAAAGVGDPLWSASAAFADTDRDGDLDLYVANYVGFDLETHHDCFEKTTGLLFYCQPAAYPSLPDRFFRNRGDGTFEDATAAVGFAVSESMNGLGVVFGDVDNDGWPDLYVANDEEPNFLFHNRGDGTFEEVGFLSGVAVNERGSVEAGMGVDLGDVDGDGWLDVMVTNFELETNALYRNLGGEVFLDHRYPARLVEPSRVPLGFGLAFADFDQDGDLDLVVANGHVKDNARSFHPNSRYPQRNQLFENDGGGGFHEVADSGLDVVRVSRGLATGDLDGDGDLDLAIVDSNDLAEVYENRGPGGGWLLVELAGRASPRHGIGARVTLDGSAGRQIREVRTASSYLSQNARAVHFGVGAAPAVRLEVAWPSGRRQRLQAVPSDRRLVIRE